jgi:hypothetical protein
MEFGKKRFISSSVKKCLFDNDFTSDEPLLELEDDGRNSFLSST